MSGKDRKKFGAKGEKKDQERKNQHNLNEETNLSSGH
jgi:hypothetical protein